MYFWNTAALANDLKNKVLEEKDYKNYYLASSIVMLLLIDICAYSGRTLTAATAVESIGSILITIMGLNMAFSANGGEAGSQFLSKSLCLSFPLTIKAFCVALGLGILWGIIFHAQLGSALLGWLNTLTSLTVQFFFFWRLITHLRATNT